MDKSISETKVLKSVAGWYLGTEEYDKEMDIWVPYARLSGYFASKDEAKNQLKQYFIFINPTIKTLWGDHNNMGVEFADKGEYIKALVCFTNSLYQDPDNIRDTVCQNIRYILRMCNKKEEIKNLFTGFKVWDETYIPIMKQDDRCNEII